MENDRESRELLLDSLENIECEWRWNETSGLLVAGALLRLELVSAVGGTDGNGEGVATGLLYEVDNLLRLGVMRRLVRNLILNAGKNSELSLNGNIILVGVLHDLPGEGDVLLVRKSGTVDHH